MNDQSKYINYILQVFDKMETTKIILTKKAA